jgi:hypothetical protein
LGWHPAGTQPVYEDAAPREVILQSKHPKMVMDPGSLNWSE